MAGHLGVPLRWSPEMERSILAVAAGVTEGILLGAFEVETFCVGTGNGV